MEVNESPSQTQVFLVNITKLLLIIIITCRASNLDTFHVIPQLFQHLQAAFFAVPFDLVRQEF